MHPLNKHNAKRWKRTWKGMFPSGNWTFVLELELWTQWAQSLFVETNEWKKEKKICSFQYPGGGFSCITQHFLHWLSCHSWEQVPQGRLSLMTKLLRQAFLAEMHTDLCVPYGECWGQRLNDYNKGPFELSISVIEEAGILSCRNQPDFIFHFMSFSNGGWKQKPISNSLLKGAPYREEVWWSPLTLSCSHTPTLCFS